MTAGPRVWQPVIARADGWAFASAAEIVVKSLLECEPTLSALFLHRCRFAREAQLAVQHDAARAALALNRFRLEDAVDGSRAVTLLREERLAGRHAAAFVANAGLNAAFAALRRLANANPTDRPPGRTIVFVEDNAVDNPNTCPRRVLRRLRLPMVEPPNLEGVGRAVAAALSMSAMDGKPCGVVLHRTLLAGFATVEMHANRLVSAEDQASWLMDRRRSRINETGDGLALVRRVELNRAVAMPAPGLREPLAIIAAGASIVAVLEMLESIGLEGRIPVLRLESISPIDESLVKRFLERCDHAIVIEPRPGSTAPRVVGLAQLARREHKHAGQVWWDEIPLDISALEGSTRKRLDAAQTTRGSLLARALEPVLRSARGGAALPITLQSEPEWSIGATMPVRGDAFTAAGAAASVESLLSQIALVHDDGVRAVALGFAVAGRTADSVAEPVPAEVISAADFLADGLALCRQVASEGRARLVVVVDLPSEADRDVRAIARALAESVGSIVVEDADLKDRDAIVAAANRALLAERATLLILRDLPPARRDPTALRLAAQEVDRLGHAALERLLWPASTLTTVRPEAWEAAVAEGLERGEIGIARDSQLVRSVTDHTHAALRIAPLAEQVEVRRSRAPSAYSRSVGRRFPPPTPIHATDAVWRLHLAGVRGDAPGVSTRLLAEAGRSLGYRVSCVHEDTPTGPGRSAWSQLVFTRDDDAGGLHPREPVGAQIPFGEASLLIALEPDEGVRAMGLDATLRVQDPLRTRVVANTAWLSDQRERPVAVSGLFQTALTASPSECVVAAPFGQLARWAMLTDRMLDLVLVGAAFQRGWIPLTVSALEAAARRLEQRGMARCLEAINLGRTLAEVGVEGAGASPVEWRAERRARRSVQDLRRAGTHGRRVAREAQEIYGLVLNATSACDGSAAGQRVRATLVEAMERVLVGGGVNHARRLAALLVSISAMDAGTCPGEFLGHAAIPACELFMPRDAVAIAAVACSPVHRRRLREALDIRSATGDEVERRFLVELDLSLAGHRWRVDMRTSDWPLRILERVGRWYPMERRLTAEAQAALESLEACVSRARSEPHARDQWIAWAASFSQLVATRLKEGAGSLSITAAEIDALAPASPFPPSA